MRCDLFKITALCFLVSLFSNVVISREISLVTGNYKILKDSLDTSIQEGFIKLKGKVIDQNSMEPIPFVNLSNYQKTLGTTTDIDGKFQLLFPIKDSIVYCYVVGWSELTFNGPLTSQHFIEVDFYLYQSVIYNFKPVIYAYNAGSSLTINVTPNGNFTFKYPKTEGSWNAVTNSDGSITDIATNKKHPYLFWEALANKLEFEEQNQEIFGYVIKTDTSISFLENVLTAYGLNFREKADFITFWGPKIMSKKYALLQFWDTQSYENKIAKLNISIRPESLLRVYLLFLPLDNLDDIKVKIKEPKIEKFERKGFTVVEWGGSILTHSTIING